MPLLVFESFDSPESARPPWVEIDAPEGARLVDLCDERNAPVPFSCRSASCGTCRIDVLEGGELLEPPQDEELDVLDIFGDDPKKRRLACQARALPGPGRVRLRAINS
jgi:ferredoxin